MITCSICNRSLETSCLLRDDCVTTQAAETSGLNQLLIDPPYAFADRQRLERICAGVGLSNKRHTIADKLVLPSICNRDILRLITLAFSSMGEDDLAKLLSNYGLSETEEPAVISVQARALMFTVDILQQNTYTRIQLAGLTLAIAENQGLDKKQDWYQAVEKVVNEVWTQYQGE